MIIDFAHAGAFAAAALALNLLPGPDVALVCGYALRGGRAAGVRAALGIGASGVVHVAGAALGVSALIAASAIAFTALKLAGAIYLACLGLGLLLRRSDASTAPVPAPPPRRIALAAFVAGALNPKVALFFVCFLPQFVDPHGGPAWAQMLLLGGWFMVSGTTVTMLYALAAGKLGDRIAAGRWRGACEPAVGTLFVALGVRLVASAAK